jgi:hypothetical protein
LEHANSGMMSAQAAMNVRIEELEKSIEERSRKVS